MYKKAKHLFLHVCKSVGLFHIFKLLTKNKLRVLCYHHFTTDDKINFDPSLFIHPHTLQQRIRYLKSQKFNVLDLDTAIARLYQDRLPAYSTVITIDDGWYHILLAHEVLKKESLPYTIYVSSYYSKHQSPLFNITIKYFFWKTRKETINIKDLGLPFGDVVALSDADAVAKVVDQLIDYGFSNLDNSERNNLLIKIDKLLDCNFDEIQGSRVFHFLSSSEIATLVDAGVDIQLHTYRHRWPGDRALALKELRDDRAYLEPIVGKPLLHFCYPSGVWSKEQLAFLREANVKSATTCEPGLNSPATNHLLLHRFLDSENTSAIEFEAEMSGFLAILRSIRTRLSRR